MNNFNEEYPLGGSIEPYDIERDKQLEREIEEEAERKAKEEGQPSDEELEDMAKESNNNKHE